MGLKPLDEPVAIVLDKLAHRELVLHALVHEVELPLEGLPVLPGLPGLPGLGLEEGEVLHHLVGEPRRAARDLPDPVRHERTLLERAGQGLHEPLAGVDLL